jgi:hypothetical protein
MSSIVVYLVMAQGAESPIDTEEFEYASIASIVIVQTGSLVIVVESISNRC